MLDTLLQMIATFFDDDEWTAQATLVDHPHLVKPGSGCSNEIVSPSASSPVKSSQDGQDSRRVFQRIVRKGLNFEVIFCNKSYSFNPVKNGYLCRI